MSDGGYGQPNNQQPNYGQPGPPTGPPGAFGPPPGYGPTPQPGTDQSGAYQPQPGYGQYPGQSGYGGPNAGQAYGQPTAGQPQYGQPAAGQLYGQPPYGQPPYGQPAYGQPQYGQPAYGQPAYGQFGPGQSGYAAPKKGWTRTRISMLVVLAVVVLGTLSAVFTHSGSSGTDRTLTAPVTSGAYSQISDSAQAASNEEIQASLSAKYGASAKVTTAEYADSSAQPAFIFIGIEAPQLHNSTPLTSANTLLNGTGVTDIATEDAGQLGGVLRCGTQNATTICAWADHNTLGYLEFLSLNGSAASAEVVAFRADAEH
jgi:hypothetical protein